MWQRTKKRLKKRLLGVGFGKLRSALKKTSDLLNTDIRDLWKSEGQLVDEDFLKELFAILVRSDMGQKRLLASEIVSRPISVDAKSSWNRSLPALAMKFVNR